MLCFIPKLVQLLNGSFLHINFSLSRKFFNNEIPFQKLIARLCQGFLGGSAVGADVFEEKVHKVELTESTIQANSRLFDSIDDVPRYAYTMGIGEIMSAKRILIVASGKVKAPIVKELIEGPVRPEVPASILKFHNDVILIADEDALSLVK